MGISVGNNLIMIIICNSKAVKLWPSLFLLLSVLMSLSHVWWWILLQSFVVFLCSIGGPAALRSPATDACA